MAAGGHETDAAKMQRHAGRQAVAPEGYAAEGAAITGNGGARRVGPDGHEARAAFTQDEDAALAAWVQHGGSLLLVADHVPFASAARPASPLLPMAVSTLRTKRSRPMRLTGDL